MQESRFKNKELTKNLPQNLPIFPLQGVLLLPHSLLPLNIFEQRYLNMIDDALRAERMIGMIQPDMRAQAKEPASSNKPATYKTGCAGKIISFSETPDGRYLVTLNGISRFDVHQELESPRGYRLIQPIWAPYEQDLEEASDVQVDRDKMTSLLREYFIKEDIKCEWDMILKADDEKMIAALAMICPFQPQEKQALLEAPSAQERVTLFMTILEMAVCGGDVTDMAH